VFVTHLAWRLNHGFVRLRQTRAVVDKVFELAPIKGDTLPPVLMGDFNADPDSDEMRYLRGLTAIDGRTVYFADAWLYGGDGGSGATFDRKNHHASDAREPSRRIDYIYVRGPDSLLRGEPIETRVAFDTPGPSGVVWPSDHFGVVTDVVFAPRSP
jgi:endonuclease/exonuclease/phosphatase family metal-dependent hydrolase